LQILDVTGGKRFSANGTTHKITPYGLELSFMDRHPKLSPV